MAVESRVVVNLFVCHSIINLTSSMFEPRPSFPIPVQSVHTEQFTTAVMLSHVLKPCSYDCIVHVETVPGACRMLPW